MFIELILSLLVLATELPQCPCPTKPTLEDSFKKADVIFVGSVKEISIHPLKPHYKQIRFTVNRKIKGFDEIGNAAVLVYTPNGNEGQCPVSFTQGMDYLVYAYGNPAFLRTNTCANTNVVESVFLDIQRLIRMSGAE